MATFSKLAGHKPQFSSGKHNAGSVNTLFVSKMRVAASTAHQFLFQNICQRKA